MRKIACSSHSWPAAGLGFEPKCLQTPELRLLTTRVTCARIITIVATSVCNKLMRLYKCFTREPIRTLQVGGITMIIHKMSLRDSGRQRGKSSGWFRNFEIPRALLGEGWGLGDGLGELSHSPFLHRSGTESCSSRTHHTGAEDHLLTPGRSHFGSWSQYSPHSISQRRKGTEA